MQHSSLDCGGFDVWIAHISNYVVPYIWDRQTTYGEESWFYTLDSAPHAPSSHL